MKKIEIQEISLMAILLTLLIVCSKITIPLPTGVSFTLQTLAVSLIYFILGIKKTLLILFTYIVIGLIGLPVFSTGGGFSYILSVTFGYIIGFIPMVICIFLLNRLNIIIKCLSLIPLYLFGAVYMFLVFKFHLNAEKSFIWILQISILPFIIKDILSILLAHSIFNRLKKNNILNLEEKEKKTN